MGVSEPSAVSVEIDELVVEGLGRPAAHRMSAALEVELGRLIGERGVPAGLSEPGGAAALDLDDVELAAGTPPERLGRGLAAALYRKLE
ncbi:MAG: hypothetical protein GY719_23050 [bacterium]|nr:hypothetical protein [bacterium]